MIRINRSIFLLLLLFVYTDAYSQAIHEDTVDISLEKLIVKGANDTLQLKGEITLLKSNNNDIEMEPTWSKYLIPILLGLLAGLIALYQVQLNNITSAKIKWIENFRIALSSYFMNIDSSSTNLINFLEIKKTESSSDKKSNKYYEFYDKYCVATDLATQEYFQIKLLINKGNKEFINLDLLINELDNLYGDVKNDEDKCRLKEKINACLEYSQHVLTKEWDAIRKPSFKLFGKKS